MGILNFLKRWEEVAHEEQGVFYDNCGRTLKKANKDIEVCTIKPGTVEIGDNAFERCQWLREIVIPEGVERIGDNAFYGCRSLRSITLPDSLEKIGFHTFAGCTGLTSVTIPSSVTNIGQNAFNQLW